MQARFLIGYCWLMFCCAAHAQGQRPPFPSTDAFATFFGIPASSVTVENGTRGANDSQQYAGTVLQAWHFKPTNTAFWPIRSVLTERGVLLPAERIAKIDEYLSRGIDTNFVLFHKVQIGDAKGYVGVAGFGPGGSALSLDMYLPSIDADLRIELLLIENDNDVYPVLKPSEKDLFKPLIGLASNAVNIVLRSYSDIKPTRVNAGSEPATKPSRSDDPPNSPPASSDESGSVPSAAPTEGKKAGHSWTWTVSGILLLGVAIFVVRKARTP